MMEKEDKYYRNMLHICDNPLRESPQICNITTICISHLHRTLRVLAFILRNFQGTHYVGGCFNKYFVFMRRWLATYCSKLQQEPSQTALIRSLRDICILLFHGYGYSLRSFII